MNDFQPTSPVFQGMQGTAPLGFDPAGIGPNSPAAAMPQPSPGVGVLGPFGQQQQQFLAPSTINSGAFPHVDQGPVEPNNMQFYSNMQQQPFPEVSMNGGQMGGMAPAAAGFNPDQPYCSPLAQMMNQVGSMGGNPMPAQAPQTQQQMAYGFVGGPPQQNQFIQQQIPSFPPLDINQPMQMQQHQQLNHTASSDFPDLDALFNDGDFKPDSKAGELAQIDLDQVKRVAILN